MLRKLAERANAAKLQSAYGTGTVRLVLQDPRANEPLILMDSDIHYLPVFAGDEGTTFNEVFLTHSKNVLPELVPEYAFLSDVVRVVDVTEASDGKVLQVLMNAETLISCPVTVDHWEDQLKGLIERHFEETGSQRAGDILQHWDVEKANFLQVCSIEMLAHLPAPLGIEEGAATA